MSHCTYIFGAVCISRSSACTRHRQLLARDTVREIMYLNQKVARVSKLLLCIYTHTKKYDGNAHSNQPSISTLQIICAHGLVLLIAHRT